MPRLTSLEQKRRAEQFVNGFLWCSVCEKFLPVSEFYKVKRGPGAKKNYGYRVRCVTCDFATRDKQKTREYFHKKNRGLVKEAAELMGGSCQRCGYDEFLSSLDYHHVYPALKKYAVKARLYSKGVAGVLDEMNKCCLLCSSCHQAYTAGDWRAEFVERQDGLGYTVGAELPLDDDRYAHQPETVRQLPLGITYRQAKPNQLRLFERRQPLQKSHPHYYTQEGNS